MELDFEPSLRYIVYISLYNIYITLIRIHFNIFFFFFLLIFHFSERLNLQVAYCAKEHKAKERNPRKDLDAVFFLSFLHFVSLFFNPFQPFQLLISIFTSSQNSNLVPTFLHYSFKLNRKSSRLQKRVSERNKGLLPIEHKHSSSLIVFIYGI